MLGICKKNNVRKCFFAFFNHYCSIKINKDEPLSHFYTFKNNKEQQEKPATLCIKACLRYQLSIFLKSNSAGLGRNFLAAS